MSDLLLQFICHTCDRLSVACPDCVITVLIDPETGLPPDVAPDLTHQAPDPDAVARACRVPVCDLCVTARNANPGARDQWPTAAQRHQAHQP